MAQTAGDIIVETLIEWGIEVVFGIPGDGVNGLIESFRRYRDHVRFVQTRHEEAAAFMASGYAKLTGKLGCCVATSGPGGIHLLNGLYDAKLDAQPVVAVTGMQFHDLVQTFTQQDVELDKLYMDVSVYNSRIMGAAHARNVTELACRTALAYRGVAHITIPVDVQDQEVKNDPRSKRNVAGHTSAAHRGMHMLPAEESLNDAAKILNECKRPLVLVGRGALDARRQLAALAERIGAPVAKALQGKAAMDDESPYCIGGVGLLGTKPSQEALEECDVLFIIGSTFPYIEYYPKPGQAKVIQIDRDPQRIGLRAPVDVPLLGDSARVIDALMPRLNHRKDRPFLTKAQERMEAWKKTLHERGTRTDTPLKPQVIVHELNKILQDDAIIACDTGTLTTWAARHLMMRDGMQFVVSGNLATMAPGLPYAVAAAIAYPERQVIAYVGDGGLTMLMGELATVKKYDLNVKVIVNRNNVLGQIKWEQMVFLGHPEYVCDLEPIDFAAVAQGFGIRGYRIDEAGKCADTLNLALQTPGAAVIDCIVDPHEPPLPPKIKASQALHFAEALAKGTPHAGKIALTVGYDQVREVV